MLLKRKGACSITNKHLKVQTKMIRMEKTILEIKRVSYGSQETKDSDKEYTIKDSKNCPVGNLEEWKKFAINKKFTHLKVWDQGKVFLVLLLRRCLN